MASAPSSARFVVHGTKPTVIDVFGTLSLSAAVGLEAVVSVLVREPEVVLDLTGVDVIDEHGWDTINWALAAIEGKGGVARVRAPGLRMPA